MALDNGTKDRPPPVRCARLQRLPTRIVTMIIMAHLMQIAQAAGLLDWLNLSPQAFRQPTISDFTNHGVGIANFFSSLSQKDVASRKHSSIMRNPSVGVERRSEPLSPPPSPIAGISAKQVENAVQYIPGIGECLPSGTPLVNGQSPNLIQDFLRQVPLAQGFLRQLTPLPNIDYGRVVGKWHWVLTSSSDIEHFCATSEYQPLGKSAQTGTFSITERFLVGSEFGQPKVGFGYGVVGKNHISVYMQSDPCPYQIVAVGPISASGQYEYIILSNWAKYPIVGLLRDLRHYKTAYHYMRQWLHDNGYMNMVTESLGSFRWLDWQHCRDKTSTGRIVGSMLNNFLFGRAL